MTKAAVADYLRSLGLDPARVVVQRGVKNYAGRSCPGPDWNCTTATQVLQISTAAAGNSFSCTPSSAGTTPPNKCVIVQMSTTGNNTAACRISGTASGVTQECHVTQTSQSGTNRVEVKQELTLSGTTTSGTQLATVDQNNNTGANVVSATQRSTESVSSNAAAIGTWSQSASQDLSIDQEATTGTNTADVQQTVAQTQTAANATTGSQSQFSDQQAEVDQSSSGVSTMKTKQSETQRQTAKAGGSVAQSQVGPQGCCSSQTGNPGNTATIKQEASQTQTPSNNQTQQQSVVYTSTGNITGTQTARQDGTTSTNTFSGSTVAETQSCEDGTCTQEEPPPPPPDSWTLFQWTGGDGTVADDSPFFVSAEGPVVFSVTDAFCKGDQFAISDGETPLGTTTAVPEAPSCTAPNPGDTSDPAVAFADPTYSHGTFALAPGPHFIGITVVNSPFGQGGAYYSADPMTTAHCTGGRWATFTSPTFTSEADCLAFVGG